MMSDGDKLSDKIENLTLEKLKNEGPIDFQNLIKYLIKETINGEAPDQIIEDVLDDMAQKHKIKIEQTDLKQMVSLDSLN